MYAVWFPSARVLKVGFTEHANVGIFLSAARNRAKKRGWATGDSACIWQQPGDTRTEAWMQASLAFRWRPPFDQKFNRVCEWFRVPDLGETGIAAVLDEVYGLVPVDLSLDVPYETELPPVGAQLPMF